jgi:hypothetical protein
MDTATLVVPGAADAFSRPQLGQTALMATHDRETDGGRPPAFVTAAVRRRMAEPGSGKEHR